jgi:hypothetical protein
MADGTIDRTTIRMTYAELAAARGISLDAARRLVLRKRWPKQIGNDGLTRTLVPTEYTEPVGRDIGTDDGTGDGTDGGTDTAVILLEASVNSVAQATAALVLDGMSDVQTVVPSLREAIAALQTQLNTANERADQERQRADRADGRAQEAESRAQTAEGRLRDLQEQLAAELIEHRRIVGILTEQLTARRSWWPWRRQS